MPGLTKPTHPFKVNRETENLVLLSRDLATQSEEWYSRPTEIEFSFNNLCNLECIMCGRHDDRVPGRTMDRATGLRALDEILPCALHLIPSAYSEPFLNDLDLVAEQCAKHQVSLFLFTNGLLCTEERFRKIQPQVHQLWFSFDSHVKETYEKIRVGSRFETVVENMKRTVELAEEDGTEITFQTVLMRLNVEQLPGYVRFIHSLGGKRINVQELIPHSSAYDDLKLESAFTDEKVLALIEQAKAAARECAVDLTLKLRPPFAGEVRSLPQPIDSKAVLASLREVAMEAMARSFPRFCAMAAHFLKVTPEGNVYPCCRSPESLKMGNIKESTFEAIWNGEAYRTFRKKMFTGNYDSTCRDCYIFRGYGA